MKSFGTLALTALLVLSFSEDVAANDAYVGVDLVTSKTIYDFGGVNTGGGFSNDDHQTENVHGLALTFGMRDKWALSNTAITPEIELVWHGEHNVTSASFPGLPAPVFFYQSSVQTTRVGVNLWSRFYQDNTWRAEAGAGLGVMHRDVSTSDGILIGSEDEYIPYGQLGLRFLRTYEERGSFSFGVKYVVSDETNLNLQTPPGGGPSFGNLSLQSTSVEISVGYQFALN